MFNIYYREGLTDSEEQIAMVNAGFQTSSIIGSFRERKNTSLVIPRYSALPYAKETWIELGLAGLTPINTLQQFRYTADIQEWYEDLQEFTFHTVFDVSRIPQQDQRKWVLKGQTNSLKHLWGTHMLAEGKQGVLDVLCRLQDDSLLSTQKIVARVYEPLVTYTHGPHGIPITNEWRSFWLGDVPLGTGYYWHNYLTENGREVYDEQTGNLHQPCFTDQAREVLKKAALVLKERHGERFFYCLDVAELETGEWKIVELNSGEMAGLADVSPGIMYGNLQRELREIMLRNYQW